MKNSVFIFLMIFGWVGGMSQPIDGFHKKIDPIAFIDQNLGKKVGDGCCRDVPAQALGLREDLKYKESYMCSKLIGWKDVAPGDLIIFQNAVDKDGNVITGHTAIVYQVVDDSTIIMAHQNVWRDGERSSRINCGGAMATVYENSKLELTTLKLSDYWLKEFSQYHIAFYRF